jgi:TolB-like protein
MKQRFFLAGVLMLVCALVATAQNRINLAILPFTGGQATEGEAIAELFSYNNQLSGRFGILPRTSITMAVEQEHDFQRSSGMADAKTIAALGERLGAQYVMAGSITALGSQKLLVVTIVKIETVQQVAGDYLTYTAIEEVSGKIPAVVQNILPLLDVDTSEMEKIAVLPILSGSGINKQDADTLAQILSIALMRNESYAIYPRTASLEQVQAEFNNQLDSSITDQRQAAQLGRGENPRLVLSVAARKLGESNMFNASIINLEDGIQRQGTSEQYANLSDGITAMTMIARMLSGQSVSQAEQRRRAQDITAQANREAAERKRAQARDRFNKYAGFAFTFEYGINVISKELIAQRIFGEPASEFDHVPNKSTYDSSGNKTGSAPGDAREAPSRMGSPLGILAGFQYSWFSINSGIFIGMGYDGPSQIEYSFLQAPVLLRGDWALGNSGGNDTFGITLDAVAGMGFNFPLKAEAALAGYEYGPKTTYKAALTMSPSIILGAGIGMGTAKFTLFTDFRSVIDTAETKVKLSDGRTGSFNRGAAFNVAFGIRFQAPFYKRS